MQRTTFAEFQHLWNSSKDLATAARRAKTTPLNATSRAYRLRKCGYLLKRFRRGRKPSK